MTYDKAELVALDKKYVWHHLTQHKNFEPAIYVKGEGHAHHRHRRQDLS